MTDRKIKILAIDDDPLIRLMMKKLLSPYGELQMAASSTEALELIKNQKFHILFADLDLEEELAGLKVVQGAMKAQIYSVIVSSNTCEKIISSGYGLGASDYLNKPVDKSEIERIFFKFENFCSQKKHQEIIDDSYISQDSSTKEQLSKLKKISLSSRPVLIIGESGTGKEVVSKIITKVLDKETLSLNCGSISTQLFLSEFFGHKKGSFTGASADRTGLVEKANSGIIYLDELHLLSMEAQQALLRFIESGEYRRLGEEKLRFSNARIISATRENIKDLVSRGEFKDDLYYRLNTFEINLYPLRERPKDIELQLNYFIKKIFGEKRKLVISKEAREQILSYSFKKGNTRELISMVENWFINSIGVVTVNDLNFAQKKDSIPMDLSPEQKQYLSQFGQEKFLKGLSTLAKSYAISKSNNFSEAAKILKISKSAISKFIKENQKTYKSP